MKSSEESVGVTRLFNTLLVANRGEIALRIMRSARRIGLRVVAVHGRINGLCCW